MPVRPGETPDRGARPASSGSLGLPFPGWPDRVDWRRDGVAAGRSGALDLPGYTWRDRPAIDRGGGVYLAGDLVAAPGIRAEVSINSGLAAARAALEHAGLVHPGLDHAAPRSADAATRAGRT